MHNLGFVLLLLLISAPASAYEAVMKPVRVDSYPVEFPLIQVNIDQMRRLLQDEDRSVAGDPARNIDLLPIPFHDGTKETSTNLVARVATLPGSGTALEVRGSEWKKKTPQMIPREPVGEVRRVVVVAHHEVGKAKYRERMAGEDKGQRPALLVLVRDDRLVLVDQRWAVVGRRTTFDAEGKGRETDQYGFRTHIQDVHLANLSGVGGRYRLVADTVVQKVRGFNFAQGQFWMLPVTADGALDEGEDAWLIRPVYRDKYAKAPRVMASRVAFTQDASAVTPLTLQDAPPSFGARVRVGGAGVVGLIGDVSASAVFQGMDVDGYHSKIQGGLTIHPWIVTGRVLYRMGLADDVSSAMGLEVGSAGGQLGGGPAFRWNMATQARVFDQQLVMNGLGRLMFFGPQLFYWYDLRYGGGPRFEVGTGGFALTPLLYAGFSSGDPRSYGEIDDFTYAVQGGLDVIGSWGGTK